MFRDCALDSGDEIAELASWAFGGMVVKGRAMSAAQVREATAKLLLSIDTDGDKKVSFEEFETFFNEKKARLAEIEVSNQPIQSASQLTNQIHSQPSNHPSNQPACHPSDQPSNHPSKHPTNQPAIRPTSLLPIQPPNQPACHPNNQPATHPTNQLTKGWRYLLSAAVRLPWLNCEKLPSHLQLCSHHQ